MADSRFSQSNRMVQSRFQNLVAKQNFDSKSPILPVEIFCNFLFVIFIFYLIDFLLSSNFSA